MLRKPIVLFSVLAFVLACLFFLLPINVFDGGLIVEDGFGEYLDERPISLSYFIGMGYDSQDLIENNVKDFYLTTKGVVMAFVFILGFPALLAYRMHLKSTKKD